MDDLSDGSEHSSPPGVGETAGWRHKSIAETKAALNQEGTPLSDGLGRTFPSGERGKTLR